MVTVCVPAAPNVRDCVGPVAPSLRSQRYVTVPGPLAVICAEKFDVIGHFKLLGGLTWAKTAVTEKPDGSGKPCPTGSTQ